MTLHVTNRIAECDDKDHRQVTRSKRRCVAVHRIGGPELPGVHDAAGVARFARTQPKLGRQMPYTFVIATDGTTEQALPIDEHGPHAASWNQAAIGVACLGDFRKTAPSNEQWAACADLVAALVFWLGPETLVRGHDELPGGSADASKQCPGPLWDMGKFRREVASRCDTLRIVRPEPNQSVRAELYLGELGVAL
jgi:hypothetical protein